MAPAPGPRAGRPRGPTAGGRLAPGPGPAGCRVSGAWARLRLPGCQAAGHGRGPGVLDGYVQARNKSRASTRTRAGSACDSTAGRTRLSSSPGPGPGAAIQVEIRPRHHAALGPAGESCQCEPKLKLKTAGESAAAAAAHWQAPARRRPGVPATVRVTGPGVTDGRCSRRPGLLLRLSAALLNHSLSKRAAPGGNGGPGAAMCIRL